MKAARLAWFDSQLALAPERLVFLDECGTNTKMARLCGRSRRPVEAGRALPGGDPAWPLEDNHPDRRPYH